MILGRCVLLAASSLLSSSFASAQLSKLDQVGERLAAKLKPLRPNPALVKVWGNHTNQRRVQGLGPGQVDCWATQDGVKSNVLTLTFH